MFTRNSLMITALATTGVAFALTQANAQAVDVKGTQRTAVYQIGTIGENCSSGPYPTITRAVANNGSITTQKSSTKLDRGVCKGKSIKTVLIIYKANSGFKGRDTVSLSWKFAPHTNTSVQRAKSHRIIVNVK